MGCQNEQPENVKLDSALETHFLLIHNDQSGSARVRLRQYMDQHGESSDALFLMGLSYHQDQQYSKAVEWLNKGVSAQTGTPIYPPTWHFLGWAYFNLGELEYSKRAFEQFLELQPNEEDTLFALGLIATEEGEFFKAQQFFTQSIQASSETSMQAKATARLADVIAELGHWNTAITLYEESLKLNPDLYEAWYRLSRALRRTGKDVAADEALQEFVLARRRVRPDLDVQTRFPE